MVNAVIPLLKRPLFIALICCALLTCIRLLYLYVTPYELMFDEAQYWLWSKSVEMGYFSKPPMIAWVIRASTELCGNDSVFCIRMASPILHMITALVIYAIALRLKDSTVGLWACITYLTLPGVFFSSTLMTTDPIFLCWWALSLYCFIRATESDPSNRSHYNSLWWIAAAIAAGAGMLSKYSMLLFLLCAVGYLMVTPSKRPWLRSMPFLVAMFIAFAIFTPNIWWNIEHAFVTFGHTKANANAGGELSLNLSGFLEFLLAQWGVFGPIIFTLFIGIIIASLRKPQPSNDMTLLGWFSVPFLLVISMVSLLSRAHANWAVPTYIAAALLVVIWAIHTKRQYILQCSLAIHLSAAAAFLCYDPLMLWLDIPLTKKIDPHHRMRGNHAIASEVTALLDKHPQGVLLLDDRKLLAPLMYYAKPKAWVKWNPDGIPHDHYEMSSNILDFQPNTAFIYLSHHAKPTHILPYFKESQLLHHFDHSIYTNDNTRFYAYYLRGFKGYGL